MNARSAIQPSSTLHRALVVLPLAVLAAAGCQSYQRRPLDLKSHNAAFLARTPESPEVRTAAGGAEFSTADGISCAEAEVLALVFNADLRVARLRAGVTQAGAENAGLWADPTIGVDLTRIIQSTPEPWKVFARVGITIPISGRLEIEKQLAGVEHAAELARIAQREWVARMAVRRAFAEWSAFDAQLAITREFVARVDEILTVVDKMEKAGEMARTEARLFRIERATRAVDLASLESRAAEAELRLRQLMGMSPDAPLKLQSGASPAIPASIDRDALEHRSPAMLVAAAEYESAERMLALEVRKQYPDLHVGPGYGREDGQDQVLLGLSVPIPALNANKRAIGEARARREVARAAAETTLEQLVSGLRAAENRLAAATRRRQTLESEIVPLVDAQYADARQLARLGEVNTLVLIESLTRQQEARVRLIESRRDESVAAADVSELTGPAPATQGTNPARRDSPAKTETTP